MPVSVNLTKIDAMAAVMAVNETLRRIDERLIDHGDRVAYIACTLNREGGLGLDNKTLFLLSVFHDIGAYKTEEIDRMLEFETGDVQNHSVYGYLFLKYLTPLSKCAEAILYHHSPWEEILRSGTGYGDYAALIHLSDRIDVILNYYKDTQEITDHIGKSTAVFRQDYVRTATDALKSGKMLSAITDGSFHRENMELCSTFNLSAEEALEYLKMVVHSIDFRSEHTVTHTVDTVAFSLNIAEHFGISEDGISDIYLGALLHDIGKIAIPFSILESPGSLNDAEMKIMRTHVEETGHLITGIVPEKIARLALRHHEKLDGSGYPCGLNAAQLTFAERIVAVADIVSALSNRRSYKEAYPKEKTVAILNSMSGTQLDKQICDYVTANYDSMLSTTESGRSAVVMKYRQIRDEYAKICPVL